ncbi:biofilm formation regulator BssR [Phytobacter sp. AG2a]|jgi:biofilm regulator BssR
MTVDELTRCLLDKLLNARFELETYLHLRKAKGYMSVSETDQLKDSFFDLAREIRDRGEQLNQLLDHDSRGALYRAEEALSSAAVSLLTGRHDCPTYIAVNADKLERSLNVLNFSIDYLREHSPLEEA